MSYISFALDCVFFFFYRIFRNQFTATRLIGNKFHDPHIITRYIHLLYLSKKKKKCTLGTYCIYNYTVRVYILMVLYAYV